MKLVKFFFSKAFWSSVIIAILLTVAIAFGALKWLSSTTNHQKHIQVPDLVKLDTQQAIQKLEANELQLVVLDTLDYDKNIPPLTILEQDPKANSDVKQNRKIYVKINAAGYGQVILPNLKDMTYRQALATINSLHLKPGTITYKAFIGRDVVLGVSQKGKKLEQGSKVLKNSVIDFELGDGKVPLSAEELDVAPATE